MRITDILLEGSGLKSARVGEVYSTPEGAEFTFQNWNSQFPPKPTDLQYPTAEEAQKAAEALAKSKGAKLVWVDQPSSTKRSFAFANFEDATGKPIWIAKHFQKKSPNNTIIDKEVKAVMNWNAGRAGKLRSSAIKSDVKLKPAQLGLGAGPETPDKIIATIKDNERAAMLVPAVKEAASGQPIVFAGGKSIITALQDDFCEVIAPVAMAAGHPVVTGDFDKAVRDVFKGESLAGSTIVYPVELNNPLVDSYLMSKSGKQLGISSKGGVSGGAQATVTVAWKAKEQAKENSTGRAYIKQFPKAVEILDIIENNPAIQAPFLLARLFPGKIESEPVLKALIDFLKPGAKRYETQLTGDTAQDLKKVPKVLVPLFKEAGYNPGSFVGLICLANLAKKVADYINTSEEIQFGEAVRSFLNCSAMVQALSIVRPVGDNAEVASIRIMYPPNFKEKAKMISNSYCGTIIVTKFKVKMPKQ